MSKDKEEHVELYEKYRPHRLEDVRGQPLAIKTLTKWIDSKTIPHVILLTGPKGSGKTTVARILRDELRCVETDFLEENIADDRGVDHVRDLQRMAQHSPAYGACRVLLLDEVHQWTPDAQSAALKMLEGVPRHIYYVLVTNEPEKLKPTLRDRCSEVKFTRLHDDYIRELINKVCTQEKKAISKKVETSLIEASDGSARRALVCLHQIIGLKIEQDQLDSLTPPVIQEQAYSIAKALLSGTWSECLSVLEKVEEDPEKIRRMILASAVSFINRVRDHKKSNRGAVIIDCFEQDFFQSGKAGLYKAAYMLYQQIAQTH